MSEDNRHLYLTAEYPRTYRYSLFFVSFLLFMVVLLTLVIIPVINYKSAFSPIAFLVGLIFWIFYVTIFLDSITYRVILDKDSIEARSWRRRKKLNRSDIYGYGTGFGIQKTIVLIPKKTTHLPNMRLREYIKSDPVLKSWLLSLRDTGKVL